MAHRIEIAYKVGIRDVPGVDLMHHTPQFKPEIADIEIRKAVADK